MNWKMLKNDFKRNRTGNTALLLFMVLAAGLVAAAAIVVSQLFTSITGMYETAKPPHFLQMHKGEIDQEAIDRFNETYDGVTRWQSQGMINVFGEDLTIEGQSSTFDLADCMLDISLVKQSQEYDLLLDEKRDLLQMKPGEIGIPVILLDSYDISLGDTVVLKADGVEKEFTAAAFVHDAQMNSTLCSSTRFLISDEDYTELFGKVGEAEYLIETYFEDSGMASEYQTAYEKAGLPQNGQAITYTIIFLLSALTDIMMALIFIFVSVLLILVALLCIKYTMLAAMEEELGEIGTMKAIGMSYKDIRDMYLNKIKTLMGIGIVIGYIIACVGASSFTGHVSQTFGEQKMSLLTVGIPLAACVLVHFITCGYCRRILKKLKKVTVVDALVTGKGFSRKERVKDGLHRSRSMPVDLLLGIREVLRGFGGFMIVFVVMFIVSGIMIIPVNLQNTMEAEEFVTYMGSSVEDIMIEVEDGEQLESRYAAMKIFLEQETDISDYQELRGIKTETVDAEGEALNLHIDCGSQAGMGLQYLTGRAPADENEMALSKLNADSIGCKTGDRIMVNYQSGVKEFSISGIYQDATSGGYTGKARYTFPGEVAEKYTFTANLQEGADVQTKVSQWNAAMGSGFVIKPMGEFLNQTLGGVSRQVKTAAIAVAVIGILLAALIVILFMKLRLAKDGSRIAAMKAIGFSVIDIRKQYLFKIGFVALIGVITGTLAANVWGDNLASMIFSMVGLGISKIAFISNPWIAFVVIPVLILGVTAGMTWISSKQIKEYHIVSMINE